MRKAQTDAQLEVAKEAAAAAHSAELRKEAEAAEAAARKEAAAAEAATREATAELKRVHGELDATNVELKGARELRTALEERLKSMGKRLRSTEDSLVRASTKVSELAALLVW